MSGKHFIQNTLILTIGGILTRCLGFFYRIFLSHTIGAQGMGIYQLTIPAETLILSITVSGIQMGISRLCASLFTLKKPQKSCSCFLFGTASAFSLTSILSVFLYKEAGFLSVRILKEAQCEPILRILSFTLPLAALHQCISAFYYSQKKTVFPAALLITEQLTRIGSTWLVCQILLSEQKNLTPVITAIGSLSGELLTVLIGIIAVSQFFQNLPYRYKSEHAPKKMLKSLYSFAVPYSANRILLNLLSGIEVFLIPMQLRLSGLSHAEALSAYGILSGMAMPLILFPSTLIHSVSVLLMPSIASLHTLGSQQKIESVSRKAILFTWCMGCFCCIFFYVFGPRIGNLLFSQPETGLYIRSLTFVCPFLYLRLILSTILHGLGRSASCLLHNLAAAALRLGFVLFSVPSLGIRGYIYGILVSETLLTLLHLFTLLRHTSKSFSSSVSTTSEK